MWRPLLTSESLALAHEIVRGFPFSLWQDVTKTNGQQHRDECVRQDRDVEVGACALDGSGKFTSEKTSVCVDAVAKYGLK